MKPLPALPLGVSDCCALLSTTTLCAWLWPNWISMICRGMLGRAWQRLAVNHQLPGRSRPWFSQCGTLEQRLCAPISRSVPGRCCGETATDQICTLLDMHAPARVPPGLSLRSLTSQGAPGEDKYMMNKYLRERGDANIKSTADLIAKAKFYQDPNFPDRKQVEASRGKRHAAGHLGAPSDPPCATKPFSAVHAGTAAGRAGLTYVNRPAKKSSRRHANRT
jgi:hypothetical protein